MKFTKSLIFLLFLWLAFSCTDKNTSSEADKKTSRQNITAILSNVADNIIIPAFTDLQSKLKNLEAKAEIFTKNATNDNLKELSKAWLLAYKTWQNVEMFDIGKAEELNSYYYHMNIYPVGASKIIKAIEDSNFDFKSSDSYDRQGFPALDFMLHQEHALQKFTDTSSEKKYKTYLMAVVKQMISLTDLVANDWKSNYRDTFIANTENSETGSFNKLVNDFIFYYEKGFRANKIGIPAGKWSSVALADKVEGFYKKDVSKTLTLEAFKAIENFYNGKAYASDKTGESFKSYIEFLNRKDLSEAITNALAQAKTSIADLDANFYHQIKTDNSKMLNAYEKIQKLVNLFKVDMPQLFNVSIDYVDADGD